MSKTSLVLDMAVRRYTTPSEGGFHKLHHFLGLLRKISEHGHLKEQLVARKEGTDTP